MDASTTETRASQPFWKSPEVFVDHFLAPFYKTNTVGSFGKLWSSILLVVCSWYWIWLRLDIPQTLEAMAWVMLAYTFGTKGVQIVRTKVGNKVSNKVSTAGTPASKTAEPDATPVPDEG